MPSSVTTIPDPLIKEQSGNIVYYDSAFPPVGSISNGGYQYSIRYNGEQKSDLFSSINILSSTYDVYGGNTFAYDLSYDKIYFFKNKKIHTISCSDFSATPVIFSEEDFINPAGIEIDNSGNVYVSLVNGPGIYKLNSTGAYDDFKLGSNNYWIDNTNDNGILIDGPYDLVVQNNYLYMAQWNYMVTRFPLKGTSRTQLEIVYDARYYLKDKAFQYDILAKQYFKGVYDTSAALVLNETIPSNENVFSSDGSPVLYYRGDTEGYGTYNKNNWNWNWMYASTSANKGTNYDDYIRKENWIGSWVVDSYPSEPYNLVDGQDGYNANYDNTHGAWNYVYKIDNQVYELAIGTTKPWNSTNVNIYDNFGFNTIYDNDDRMPWWASIGLDDLKQSNTDPDGAMHMKHLTIDKTDGTIYFTVEHPDYNYIYKVTIDEQNIRHCTELYKLPLVPDYPDIINGLVMDASQNLYSLVSLNHTVNSDTTYESNIYKLGFNDLATRSQYYLDNSSVLVRTAPNPSLPVASTSFSVPNVVATGLAIDNTDTFYGGYGVDNVYQFTNQYVFRHVNLPDEGDLSLTVYNNTTEETVATINVNVICFKEDSKILCLVDNEEKYIPIQHIKVGDLVKTYLHGYKKVEVIGSSIINNSGNSERTKDKLYKYTQENYPEVSEDLVITGGHSILVDELSEEQKEATEKYWKIFHKTDDKYRLLSVVNNKAVPYENSGDFNIYHLALESDNELLNFGIYANGLLVESCCKRILTKNMNIEH